MGQCTEDFTYYSGTPRFGLCVEDEVILLRAGKHFNIPGEAMLQRSN